MTLQSQATLTRGASPTPYGLAVGRGGCIVPSGLHTAGQFSQQSNGTDTSQTARFFIPLTDPYASTVLPVFGNHWATTTSDTDAPNAITIAAAVEMSDGTVLPFTFGGAHTVTIPAGGGTLVTPDFPLWFGAQVSATDGGGSAIPINGVYLRTYVSVTSGNKWPCNIATYSNADAATVGTGADLTLTGSGAVSGGSYFYFYGPVTVLTRPHSQYKPPIVGLLSDSIFHGASDARGIWGPVARACANLRLPLAKLSRGGEYALAASSLSGIRYRGPLLDGCTHVIVEYGTNDQQLSSSSGVTTLQTRLLAIGNTLKNMGIKPYLATIPPRTTSTDSWITTTNQTPLAGANPTYLATMNQWIRAVPAPYRGVVDLAGLVSSAPDSGLWAVNGSVNYMTGDGVHPWATQIAGPVTAAVQSLMSGWTL